MKISEMIKNLEDFMKEFGDAECWYAADNEGNEYRKVFYEPTLCYVDVNNEVYTSFDDVEECGVDIEDVTPICIVN